MFASLDQLRRQPVNIPAEGDDWKWVLRSASATRPVLEWMGDGQIVAVDASMDRGRPRSRERGWNLRMVRGTRVRVRTWCRRRQRRLLTNRGWAERAG